MKKLLNRLIQPLIGKSRNSANRTNPSGDGPSTFMLTTVALICLGLLPTANATGLRVFLTRGRREDLGNGNSASAKC